MVVVLICDLLLPVGVTLPQLLIHHLLNLWTHIMSGQIAVITLHRYKDSCWSGPTEWAETRGPDLDDVVSAEHSAGVASVSVLSDGALHLRGNNENTRIYYQVKFCCWFSIHHLSHAECQQTPGSCFETQLQGPLTTSPADYYLEVSAVLRYDIIKSKWQREEGKHLQHLWITVTSSYSQ